MPSDYIPRKYHDRQVTALTDRCVEAEDALVRVLNYIDPEILQRNGRDWAQAVAELLK